MTALGWQLVNEVDAGNPVKGDLQVTGMRFARLPDRLASIAQACAVELRWWLAEWSFDTSRGTPYVEQLFVRGVDERTVRAVLGRVLRRVSGVRRIARLTFTLDRVARIGRVTDLAIETTDGSVVPVNGVFAVGGR